MQKTSFSFLFSLILFSFFQISSFAQTERAVVSLKIQDLPSYANFSERVWQGTSHIKEIPIENPEPFLAYSVAWESKKWSENDELTITFFEGDQAIESKKIAIDPHGKNSETRQVGQLYFLEKKASKFNLEYKTRRMVKNVQVHFFSPGKSEPPSPITNHQSPITNRMACPCPQPDYLDREGWCPDGTCPEDATPAFTDVTHLIVHHSAGTNSSTDWAAVVRSVWNFHVNVNNWDDVGYNWLIDPNGVIYQGRGDNVRGAHFCGNNSGTMGVCVLGDFTSITPTVEAYSSLEKLLSWKSCDIGADPLGSGFHNTSGLDLMHISGHRDGCSTACPGDAFYPTFDAIRSGVAEHIETGCNDVLIEAPTELTATVNSFTSVDLEWLDNALNETAYTVERSVNLDNNFSEIATLPADATTFTDMDVEAGTDYYYRVVADSAEYFSLYSNEVFVTTEVAAINDEGLENESVHLFPNPTSENITLSIDNQWIGEISTTILDPLGRQVLPTYFYKKASEKLQFEIDLSALPTGVFWLKIEQGNGATATKRIMHN